MPANHHPNPPHTFYRIVNVNDSSRLVLMGDYTLTALEQHLRNLAAELAAYAKDTKLHWDLTEINQVDATGIVLLRRVWNAQRPEHLSLRPDQERIFERLEKLPAPSLTAPRNLLWPITALGRIALQIWELLTGIIFLIGQLFLDIKFLVLHPKRIPWREISANLFRTGAQALGITALVGFLIGIVLSYLSSKQLQMFGADVFIINILGVSIIRELGPMLAAILVAGRSGSSMTAQLGVMRVTEELDALTVMGISHSQRLVLPKVIGLAIAMPLLVIWTSAIALMGGILAAELQLGLSHEYFLRALPDAVPIANLWLALGKGAVCGMMIALIACHFGLKIKPDTESLGEGTTSSVVSAITVVIIIDALFAVAFSDVGII
ncbi:MAG: ABC transporter permease [Nitrosomonas sp.]|nr:ABC transporter permease [Nitrosomonas sp.]MDP1950925.1 ABC transporter permease [Nitrosomonas sp.]